MYKATVHFETVVEAKAFVSICNDMDFKVELVSGPYIIDAKSIMGLFSLDLSKPIDLQAHCKSDEQFAEYEEKIRPFLVAPNASQSS